MNNDTNYQELDLMREQFAQLKNMLDKERIVNERIMRRAMGEKANKLNRQSIFFIILAIIFIPYVIFIIPMVGIPQFYGYMVALLLLIAAISEIFSAVSLSKIDFSNGNLMEISEIMVRYKRRNIQWLYFSIPYLLLWISGMFYEAIKAGNMAYIVGMGIGLVIGLTFGIRTLVKTQRIASEIIDDSRDLMA